MRGRLGKVVGAVLGVVGVAWISVAGAVAAEPATRPARVAQQMEGDRGLVLRVDEKSLVVAPLPPQPLVVTVPPQPEATLPADAPAETTYALGGDTRYSLGVVIAERMTNTGQTVRSIQMIEGKATDVQPGREVRVITGEGGAARHVMVFPKPLIDPAPPQRPRGEATTRRAAGGGFGQGPGRGPMMMDGTRGKVVRVADGSITIEPTERAPRAGDAAATAPAEQIGGEDQPKTQTRLTFKVEERTRIMLPSVTGEREDPRGRKIQRISFTNGTCADLEAGQDVVVNEGDEGVALRITVIPEGFGDRGGAGPLPTSRRAGRATTRPAAAE